MLTDYFQAMLNSGYISTKKYKTMNYLGFIAMMNPTDVDLCDINPL